MVFFRISHADANGNMLKNSEQKEIVKQIQKSLEKWVKEMQQQTLSESMVGQTFLNFFDTL
jgi:uncharacterized protein YbcI